MAAATLSSLGDPDLVMTIEHVRYPRPAVVRDVNVKMWDGRTKPEVHYGSTFYHRWSVVPIWSKDQRGEAEELMDFFTTLQGMQDKRCQLTVPAPVGSVRPPWSHVVECVNPEIVQDFAASPTATEIALEFVEVD